MLTIALPLLLAGSLGATFTVTSNTDNCTGETAGTFSKALADASADSGADTRSSIVFALTGLTQQVSGDCAISRAFTHSVFINGGNGVVLSFNAFTLGSSTSLSVANVTFNASVADSTFTGLSTGAGGSSGGNSPGKTSTVVFNTGKKSLTFAGTTFLSGASASAGSIALPANANVASSTITASAGNITIAAGAQLRDTMLVIATQHHVTAAADALLLRSPVNISGSVTDEVLGAWAPSVDAPAAPVLSAATVTGSGEASAQGTVTTAGAWTVSLYGHAPGTTALVYLGAATGTGAGQFTVAIEAVSGTQLLATVSTTTTTSAYSSAFTTVAAIPVSFASSAVAVDEDGVTVEIPISRAYAAGEATLALHTVDGSATAPADYVAFDSTVTFAAGETDAVLHLIINDDTLVEGDETFTVAVGDSVLDTSATGSVTVTIIDNDVAPGGTGASGGTTDTGESASDSGDGSSKNDGGCQASPAGMLAALVGAVMIMQRRKR